MKITSFVMAAAILVATVAPVLALDVEDGEIVVRSRVRSYVTTHANTGDNWAVNGLINYNSEADDTTFLGYNRIRTGHADALGVNTMSVNAVVGEENGNEDSLEDFSLRSRARVYSDLYATANTGGNVAISGLVNLNSEVDDLDVQATNEIETGNATATGDSLIIVNSNWNDAL